ncbi:hypothetical protein BSL78_17915 [Apostichopus japonicus]|uniref:Uncharacterized protein n=1 Tax=Stichopus japonicus TaxID=307972 RepID=A0A2G8KB40_STIJA|nr:hypothetical protein BSL78_17915 [Apostichopus japonicus]
MASNQPDRPQLTSDYGRMKRNVANSLTVVDTLNIATIFNFSTASIDELESKRAPGFLLLRILEQHGILGESKVDELEEALREVNLEMAVRHVHRYKDSLPIPRIPRHPSESSLASEDSGIAASGCHSQVLSLSELDLDCQQPPVVEAFCNHCNQVITWRSAASEHASHNHAIIAGEKLTVEVAQRKMEICTELDSITEKMKTTQGAVEEQMHHGRLPKMVEEVERLAKEFQEKVETRKRELIDHLSRSEAERSSQIEDYRKDVEDMLGLCGSVKKELTASSDERRSTGK